MAKYYSVRKGRTCGIFHTWDECRKQTDGFAGAEFKSFSSIEDAKSYLEGTLQTDVSCKTKETASKQSRSAQLLGDIPKDTVCAYCDGSYDADKKLYGWGAVIIEPDRTESEISGVGGHISYLSARNVAGETRGALEAMRWAVNHGYKKLRLHHDYMGISAWGKGDWKANVPVSMDYWEEYLKLAEKLEVVFVKVKGHSGDIYNDMADGLAAKALSEVSLDANDLAEEVMR